MVDTVGYSAGTGAVQGAVAGGTIGSVAGPWGTAIGAAVGGVIGGVSGLAGGRKARKSKKYSRLASNIQSEREANAVADQYRQMLRTARVARAGSMSASIASGITTSSLATSALSSIGSQAQYNVQYLAEDRRLYSIYKRYMEKAGQLANDYQNTMTTIDLASTALTYFGQSNLWQKYAGSSLTNSTANLFGYSYDPTIKTYALNNPSQAPNAGTIPQPGWNASLGGVTIQDLE